MSVSSNWGRRPEVAVAPATLEVQTMAVLTCREAFAYHDASGNQAFVVEGDTVNADDPIVRGRESMFKPFEVTHVSAVPAKQAVRR